MTAGWRILGMVAVMIVAACAGREPPIAAGEEPLLTSLQVYTSGAEVGFVLHVTNVSDGPVELNFRSGQSYDFVVREGDREVWRWSDGQMFTQALRRERMEPGESRQYEAVWRPEQPMAGEFEAIGMLTASDHRVEQATRIALP